MTDAQPLPPTSIRLGADEPSDRARLRMLEEQTWVLLARGGDREAFWKLVDAYDRRLLYFVRRFVPDTGPALDIVQDVWLTVFRRLRGLREPTAFRAWVYQIAHDQVVRHIRSQVRDRRDLAAARQVAAPEPHDVRLDLENAELVHRGLSALSVEHREALTLRFLEDMSLEEIAQATRCNLGTVKSRLHYAKLAMREQVERLSHE